MIKSNGKKYDVAFWWVICMWYCSMSCTCLTQAHPTMSLHSSHIILYQHKSSQCLRIEYNSIFSLFLPQLLLPNCICFSCSLWLHQLQLLIPDFICFSCFLQLHPLQLLLPDCIHFSFFSVIISASTAAPQLHLLVITHTVYKVLSMKVINH